MKHKLTAKQLKSIRDNFPDIDIELDWNHGNGYYNDTTQIVVKDYILSIGIKIVGISDPLKSGFMEDNDWSDPTYTVEVMSIEVWDSESRQITLDKKSYRSIEVAILNNVRYE